MLLLTSSPLLPPSIHTIQRVPRVKSPCSVCVLHNAEKRERSFSSSFFFLSFFSRVTRHFPIDPKSRMFVDPVACESFVPVRLNSASFDATHQSSLRERGLPLNWIETRVPRNT